GRGRMLAGLALGLVALPGLTIGLSACRSRVPLIDDLLLYLVVVIGVTVVGGIWPSVIAAVAAALLVNWYFTPPLHTFSIDAPANLLALLLFVGIALSVSVLVLLSALQAVLAAGH